jgi:flagellar hook-associated protein 3 FlgL
MIRVTQLQLHDASLNAMMRSRAQLQRVQQEAMTGERVTKPSDDPSASARARLLGDLEARGNTYESVTNMGVARLQVAEQSLAEVGNLLVRARELATAMANETMTADQRASAAIETEQLRRALVDLVNTRDGEEYVFAHVDTRSPPYQDGVGFTYDVDTYEQVREAEVAQGRRAEIGASGSRAFAQRAADAGSIDVVAAVAGLRDALDANDPDAVRATIDTLTAAFDQSLGERTAVGERMAVLQRAGEQAQQSATVVAGLRSDLLDADITDALSRLQLAETTVRAALSVAARMLGPSLLDAG